MNSSLKKLIRAREILQKNDGTTGNTNFPTIATKQLSNLNDKFISRIEDRSNYFLNHEFIGRSKSDEVEHLVLRIGNGYCNAHCDYCYVDFSEYDTNKSIKEYIKENTRILKRRLDLILNSFVFSENIYVDFFTHGESLLFQELIIDAVKLFLKKFDKEKITFRIFTNGSIPFSPDFLSLFSLTKNFLFKVSYDGCPSLQETHRKINTKKILNFIETLRRYQIQYTIHSVITPDWLEKEDQVALFCYKNFYDGNSIAMLPYNETVYLSNKNPFDTFAYPVLHKIYLNLIFYFGLLGLLEKIPAFNVSSFCMMNKKLFYSLEDEEIYYCDVFKNNHFGEFKEVVNDKKFEPLVKRVLRGNFEGDSIIKYNNKKIFIKKAELVKEIKKSNLCFLEPDQKCPFSKACISYLSCPGNFFRKTNFVHQGCMKKAGQYLEFIKSLYLEKRAFPILFRDREGNLSIKGYQYTLPLKEEILSVNFSLF
ncbi:MAG: Radical superfamily, partial [Candidatus Woesearchaeota archaeon]|nr:Radical superfamily [Candidatus Woesearchaeota archaeon]